MIQLYNPSIKGGYRPSCVQYRNMIVHLRGGHSLFRVMMRDITEGLPEHIKLYNDGGLYTFEVIKEGQIVLTYQINKFVGLYNFQMTYWYITGGVFASYYDFICDYWWYPPVGERTEWDITGGNYDYYFND